MIGTKIFFAVFTVLASVFTADAAVIELFSDNNCQQSAGTRNVWDNTCARTGGFESMIITAAGGPGQMIAAYLRNDCVIPVNRCVPAGDTGRCIPAWSNSGASHALSSYWSLSGRC